MTGPTMLTPKASGAGAGCICSSSLKIYCCTELHPVPPYSFGQCETPQPFLLRMRHQATISSLLRWRPSTSFCRVAGGTLSLKNERTSSRNAISSLLNARSIESSCHESPRARPSEFLFRFPDRVANAHPGYRSMHHFEQTRGSHAPADAHCHDGVFRLAAAALDQRMTGETRAG